MEDLMKKALEMEYPLHTRKEYLQKQLAKGLSVRDKIKDDFCKANNIDLLRISYDDF